MTSLEIKILLHIHDHGTPYHGPDSNSRIADAFRKLIRLGMLDRVTVLPRGKAYIERLTELEY